MNLKRISIILLLAIVVSLFVFSGIANAVDGSCVSKINYVGYFKGKVAVVVSYYLDPLDLYYYKHYVYVVDENSPEYLLGYPGKVNEIGEPLDQKQYDTWYSSLPRIWRNNPFHNHVLYFDADVTDEEIKAKIAEAGNYFYQFWQYCWDNNLDFIPQWQKVKKDTVPTRQTFIAGDLSPLNKLDCLVKVQDIITRKDEFGIDTLTLEPVNLNIGDKGTIDVGESASDRGNSMTSGLTTIALDNPANADGTIDTVEVWAYSNISNMEVATFAESGGDYSTRDNETLGAVTAGSKQTFSGLDMDVVTGDFIGCYYTAGSLERDGSGYAGVMYKSGDYIPSASNSYSLASGDTLSLYGTGTEAGGSTPTVSTNAASDVEDTTATLNGTVDDDGGETIDYYGFVWDDDSDEGDPGDADPSGPPGTWENGWKSDVGDYGEAAFDHAISGLSTGTTYHYRAAAHNTNGWSYGSDQTFLTKPAAPTNVAATDGASETKVTVTWTKSTGATGYKVYRDGGLVDTVGDVDTYDDNGATAATITNAGTASASNGTSTAHVTLSLAGEATGTTSHTYKVKALNGTGDSDDSDTDTGYRGVGAITYQWQVDSGGGFGNIGGATTDPYNYTGAGAPTITPGAADASDGTSQNYTRLTVTGEHGNNGSTWDYQCIVSATGASNSPQTSTSDTGYRGIGALSYEWFRSDADADAAYATIAGEGGVTEPYNDTNGVFTPDGRWYYAEVSMADAVTQDTTHDRGYRAVAGTMWIPFPLVIPFIPLAKNIFKRRQKQNGH